MVDNGPLFSQDAKRNSLFVNDLIRDVAVEFLSDTISRTYGKTFGQVLWTRTRVLGTCSPTLPQQTHTQSGQG